MITKMFSISIKFALLIHVRKIKAREATRSQSCTGDVVNHLSSLQGVLGHLLDRACLCM